jgi:hypothetical protein
MTWHAPRQWRGGAEVAAYAVASWVTFGDLARGKAVDCGITIVGIGSSGITSTGIASTGIVNTGITDAGAHEQQGFRK